MLSFIFKLFSSKPSAISRLNTPDFKKSISDKKVQLIDVRTPMEFLSGHIKKAKNIDYYNKSKFYTEIEKLNKNKPVYLYCRSGIRSYNAAKKLDKLGFTEIYDLKGGFLRWKQ